jgi:hypothetical protein
MFSLSFGVFKTPKDFELVFPNLKNFDFGFPKPLEF